MVRRKAAELEITHSSPTTGGDSLRSRQQGAECTKSEDRPLLFALRELSTPVAGEE
jgi:hypothetical protein